jgi:aspartokinase-like uncharacterized kinase
MTATVLKVGGSLSRKPEALKALCQQLSLLAEEQHLVVVPGGGIFADCVRMLDKRFSLSSKTAHRMAILGMDQYGLLLSDLNANCRVVHSLEEAKTATEGRLVVFLPSSFMFVDDGLPNSWEVTSDSIAAYIAGKLAAERLVLVKDVDGIFNNDPRTSTQAELLKRLTVDELEGLHGGTCVDLYLPKLLRKLGFDCFVVNGLYPERVKAALKGQVTVGTVISPSL